MPWWWACRYRLGEPAIDPDLRKHVFNHVFEVVDTPAAPAAAKAEADAKSLEAVLAHLRSK